MSDVDKLKMIVNTKEYLGSQEKNPYCSEIVILQPEHFNWLIAEVERLGGKYKEAEEHLLIYTQGQDRRILREIESLTTERDELKVLYENNKINRWQNFDLAQERRLKIEKPKP